MNSTTRLRRALLQAQASASVFVRDVGSGMLEVSHNGLAMVGLSVVMLGAAAIARPDLVEDTERWTLEWLRARHELRADTQPDLLAAIAEPEGVQRATAADPKELSRQQALVAQWIAKRYRVAPEPIAKLVQEAWDMGKRSQLDPTLILAIMAIESSFNPFAQSPVGAQGLMQVMTHIHPEKYVAFGGNHAAFDPVSNVRVGVQVLRECIARAGSLEGGLKYYVGAANLPDDGGYAHKVLSEQGFLRRVQLGEKVAVTVIAPPPPPPAPSPALETVNSPEHSPAMPVDQASGDEKVARAQEPVR